MLSSRRCAGSRLLESQPVHLDIGCREPVDGRALCLVHEQHLLAVGQNLVVPVRADAAWTDLDMHSILQPRALGSRRYSGDGGLVCARCIHTDVNIPGFENLTSPPT